MQITLPLYLIKKKSQIILLFYLTQTTAFFELEKIKNKLAQSFNFNNSFAIQKILEQTSINKLVSYKKTNPF